MRRFQPKSARQQEHRKASLLLLPQLWEDRGVSIVDQDQEIQLKGSKCSYPHLVKRVTEYFDVILSGKKGIRGSRAE